MAGATDLLELLASSSGSDSQSDSSFIFSIHKTLVERKLELAVRHFVPVGYCVPSQSSQPHAAVLHFGGSSLNSPCPRLLQLSSPPFFIGTLSSS